MNHCKRTALKHDIDRAARLANVQPPDFKRLTNRGLRKLARDLGLSRKH
jgi:hypothetical protein